MPASALPVQSMVGVAMQNLIHHTTGTVDTPSPKQPSRGDPARSRPRRAFTGLAVAVVSAVTVASAGCASSSASSPAQSSASSPAAAQHTSSSSGAIHFPATLFGVARNTSADAQQFAHQMTHQFAMLGMFAHPQAAVYGTSPDSQLFVLVISDLSATAKKYGGKTSAAGLRRGLLIMGATGVRTFPAGKGAALGCGHMTRSGVTATFCARYTKKNVGIGMYFNGVASSLSDAASKTNQAISASGG